MLTFEWFTLLETNINAWHDDANGVFSSAVIIDVIARLTSVIQTCDGIFGSSL